MTELKSTEDLAIRIKMVSMHQFFLDRIDESLESQKYFEASWLIYSCIENRYFRVLDKYKRECKYCTKGRKCRKRTNQLALSTKIACVERLANADIECVQSFTGDLLSETRKWIKNRNALMHNLLSLEDYEIKFDSDFKELAEDGKTILDKTYAASTEFRKKFFSDDYQFIFPEECMDKCPCARQANEEGGEKDK